MAIETKIATVRVPMPTLGLYTALPGLFVDKRYSPTMDNVRLYAGEVLNRPGSTYVPSASQTLDNIPNGGALLQEADGTLASVLGTKLKWYSYAPSTWTDITGAAVFTGGDGDLWDFAVVHGILVGSNGVSTNLCYEWPGTGNIAQLANSYAARYVEAFADRIFLHYTVESGTTIGDRVRWSASGSANHDVWSPASDATAGFLDLVDTPGVITGAKGLFGRHYVFKRDYIHRFTETGLTTPSFIQQTVVDGIGCVEGRTIVEIDGMLYFLGRENIYRWDTAGRPEPIGTTIRNEVFNNLRRDRVRRAFAFHHELYNEYWLCVPGTGVDWPDTAYIYNFIAKSWSKAMISATCHAPYRETAASPTIDSLTDDIDSYVETFDSAIGGADVFFPLLGKEDKKPVQVDDTTISDADSTTPALSFDSADTVFGDPQKHDLATAHRVILSVRGRSSAAVAVQLSVDGGQVWTSLGSRTTTGDNSLQYLYYPCRATGQHGRVRITTSDPLALLGLTYEIMHRAEDR